MRLQATIHYLFHNIYRYVYIRECMPIYLKSPKVTITFFRMLHKKCIVSFTFQTLNLSSVKIFRAIPICFMVISLVNHTLTCALITMGRFKFMDNNFSLSTSKVTVP